MKYQTLVVALLIGATQSVSLNTMFRPPVYDKKPEKVQEVTVDEEFEETMSSIKESENEKHHLLKTPEKDNTKVGIDAEDPKQGLEQLQQENFEKKEILDSLKSAEKELGHKMSTPVQEKEVVADFSQAFTKAESFSHSQKDTQTTMDSLAEAQKEADKRAKEEEAKAK